MANSENRPQPSGVPISITPWLSVRDSKAAVDFYKFAFGAEEVYRLEGENGDIVSRLSVDGAEFWLSEASPAGETGKPENAGIGSVRMILTVSNPEVFFDQAIKAGATEIFPVSEDYGWKLGKLSDPFGHVWEIGYEL
jgi:PhnB protein